MRSCARRTDSRPLPLAGAEQEEHADAAADGGRHRRAGHAQAGEGAQPEHEQRPEQDVDPVGQPERPHGDRGVARAAEGGVDEEQQHDADVADQHELRVARTDRHHRGRRTHHGQQGGAEDGAGRPDHRGQSEADEDRLRRRARGAVGILGAGPPRDDRAHAHRHPHADGVDDGQQALGQSHGGDGVGAQLGDPEDVGDGEDRLHHHLQDHRHGEQQDGPRQRDGRQIPPRAGQRLPHEGPEPLVRGDGRGLGSGGLIVFDRRGRHLLLRGFVGCRPESRDRRKDDPRPVRPGSSSASNYPRETRPAPSTTARGSGFGARLLPMAFRKAMRRKRG